jgi:Mn2+/Fe2+ NRAMP family transporter
LNGLILPLLVGLLILLINRRQLVPEQHRPGWFYNVLLLLIFACVLAIGLNQVIKTLTSLGIF